MDEKTMVNDILAGVKSDLTAYQTAITEAENMHKLEIVMKVFNLSYLKWLKRKDIINLQLKQL